MPESKVETRKRIRALRDAVPAELRAEWSTCICQRAMALPAYQSACTVHIFLSFQSEVNTRAILEHALAHGKRVVVPLFVKNSDETPCSQILSLDDSEFNFGKWGLRTPKVIRPVPLYEIDLVFVPMVAFSPLLHAGEGWGKGAYARIGYGAGFYDRFLKRIRPGVPKIGLAFSMQQVESIPIQWSDVLIDDVVAET